MTPTPGTTPRLAQHADDCDHYRVRECSCGLEPAPEREAAEAALTEALRLMRKYPPDAAGPDFVRFLRAHTALEQAANEGRNVLPDATDDQASAIEQWALAAHGAEEERE